MDSSLRTVPMDFLLALTWCMLAVKIASAEDLSQCLKEKLPAEVQEWQEDVAGSSVRVEWGYGNITCNSVLSCLGPQAGVDAPMEPQLVPLEIQQGLQVKFFATPSGDVPFKILPMLVSLEAFRTCDPAAGQPILNESTSDEFLVPQRYLQPGTNYFIVKTEDAIFKCEYGLRLNLTVKTSRCVGTGDLRPCWGQGRCLTVRTQADYTCSCCDGFTGSVCQDLDACHSSPCHNQATCVDVPDDPTGTKHRCLCPQGFYGADCGNQVDSFCGLDLCKNGGVCDGNQTHYVCRCPEGFTGHHCEININECSPNPCKNGICVDKVAGYQCYCIPGFAGTNCETGHDQCKNSPCKNDGFCIDRKDHFLCDCPRGFTGQDCSLKVDLCKPNPCNGGGLCEDMGETYVCHCKEGFEGSHCEVNVNECLSNPCSPRARCLDRLNGYDCLCPPGFAGRHCDLPLTMPRIPEEAVVPDKGPVGGISHLNNLFIVAGTLGGAILLALAVLAGCYCRTYRVFPCRRAQYERHECSYGDDTAMHPDVSSVAKPRPSAEAIYEATIPIYKTNSIRDPLINSLKSKKV